MLAKLVHQAKVSDADAYRYDYDDPKYGTESDVELDKGTLEYLCTVQLRLSTFLTSAACAGAIKTQTGACLARSSPGRPLFLFLASAVYSV
jgi:hypothetical protein